MLAALALSWATPVPAQLPPPGECPQPRFTGKAPDEFYNLANPLTADPARIAVGRRLYEKDASPACEMCHGIKGDGKGALAAQFDPRPRNFACAQTVNGIPDGQLFWIVRNGSPGTSMPGFKRLSDEQIWSIVLYLRRLAKPQ
ncbi:MAG TPA: cytochrome c [Burkholderiales bacterium]|nr:cytochrome c [Burkholderiales bacterium]